MVCDTLKLCSLNVNGRRDKVKRNSIFGRLRQKGWDVIFLQETHCDNNVVSLWKTEWGGDAYFANGDSASRGVAILFKHGLDVNVSMTSIDPAGRYIMMQISFQDENYCLGNIYAPTPQYELDQIATVDKIEEIIVQWDSGNILLGGDFNIQLDPQLDRKNSSYQIKAARYRLEVLNMVERLTG